MKTFNNMTSDDKEIKAQVYAQKNRDEKFKTLSISHHKTKLAIAISKGDKVGEQDARDILNDLDNNILSSSYKAKFIIDDTEYYYSTEEHKVTTRGTMVRFY